MHVFCAKFTIEILHATYTFVKILGFEPTTSSFHSRGFGICGSCKLHMVGFFGYLFHGALLYSMHPNKYMNLD